MEMKNKLIIGLLLIAQVSGIQAIGLVQRGNPAKEKWQNFVIGQLSPQQQAEYYRLSMNRARSKEDNQIYNNFWQTVVIPEMQKIWTAEAKSISNVEEASRR